MCLQRTRKSTKIVARDFTVRGQLYWSVYLGYCCGIETLYLDICQVRLLWPVI